MRNVSVALAAVLALVLAGCSHYPGGIAPSTVPLAPGGYTVVTENVVGSDCLIKLLMLIPISGGNRTDEAVKDALEQTPGATALVNVTADMFSQGWILWSNTCTEVRGTAVKPN